MTVTTDTPLRKYLFDRSFDQAGRNDKAPDKLVTYNQEQLDKAREEAFREGQTAGEQVAVKQQTARNTTILTQIERQLEKLIGEASALRQRDMSATLDVAMNIARKLLPDYVARQGTAEIEALVQQALSDLSREPRLVIRVAESQFDALNGQLETLTQQTAYAGKIVLLADAAMDTSDCKIEWADGGIERDTRVIWQEIDRAVARAKGHSGSAPQAGATTSDETQPTTNLAV
jgi:flagellar assembly protein FliH